MSKKVSIEEVKTKLLKDNNELLDTEYINNRTKMKYRCKKHDLVSYAIWVHIKKGKYSCPLCKKENISKSKILQYEKVKQKVETHGYVLISTEYNGRNDKLLMYCKNHGEFKQSLNCLYSGSGCQMCGRENMSKKQKLTYEFVKNEFQKRNYILTEKEYVNCETPMKYICPKHPDRDNYINYSNLKHGKGCLECHLDRNSGENSNFWKGGITKESKSIRSGIEYKNWRRNIFLRDNYTCQCCNAYGVRLNAHHIENFSDNVEKRLDIENGITLCESCHSISIKGSFHNIYGTRNNNRKQLEEYIKNKRLCADIL